MNENQARKIMRNELKYASADCVEAYDIAIKSLTMMIRIKKIISGILLIMCGLCFIFGMIAFSAVVDGSELTAVVGLAFVFLSAFFGNAYEMRTKNAGRYF